MKQISIGVVILAVIIISDNLGLKHGADSKICIESDCSFECTPGLGCRLKKKND